MIKKVWFFICVFFAVYDLWAMIATATGWLKPEVLHQTIGFYFAFSYWLESAYNSYKDMKGGKHNDN